MALTRVNSDLVLLDGSKQDYTPGTVGARLAEKISICDFPWLAKADGATTGTDNTAAIQAALDTGLTVEFPDCGPGQFYKVTDTLYDRHPGRELIGFGNAEVRLVKANGSMAVGLIVATTAAVGGACKNIIWNQNAANLVQNTNLPYSGNIALHTAFMVMANGYEVINCGVKNSWDNGIGIGEASLTTGTQVNGSPQRWLVDGVLSENCGCGVTLGGNQAGGGVNVLTGSNGVVANCRDYQSRTGMILDYGGGGQAQFVNCVSVNAKKSIDGTAGYGFYCGGTNSTWTNCYSFLSEARGAWFDAFSINNTVCGMTCKGAAAQGFLIQGKRSTFIGLSADDCSLGNSGVYDAIELVGSVDNGSGGFTNSTDIILVAPQVSGSNHRYGLRIRSDAGNLMGGYADVGNIGAGTAGRVNNAQTATFMVTAKGRVGRVGYGADFAQHQHHFFGTPYTGLPGDGDGTGMFALSPFTDAEAKLAITYDSTNLKWRLQAIQAGVVARRLDIQPGNGSLQLGTGIWQNPLYIGSMRMWVDTGSSRFRYKYGSDPASETDGTLI